MNAIVIERVMKVAEKLLVRFAAIQGRIVFSGHESHGIHAELTHDVAEFRHAITAYLPIIGSLSKVACENDEIRLIVKRVDRSHSLLQRSLRIRIDVRAIETPMCVG